ncbi:MAG: triose-phosphate isomerase [Verrucomicrobiota bacterium]|jgi:triosephosphate isomerase|nr:triose-phosphate isomerase [Verrucomicrobiota bacterium]
MRKKIVAGNWKMNMTTEEAATLVNALKENLANFREAEVVVCPPFTALSTVSRLVQGTHIDLGAQNMFWEKSGAYTGEISAAMLRDLYCHYVILGHSERRQYFGETDEIVNRKTKAALASSLHPIVCVGETLAEREAGKVEMVIPTQVKGSLAGLSAKELLDSVIAYEPVWAIGTGKTATSEQAQEVHALIRKVLAEMFDATVADGVRIQYGGSVKPNNAKELFGMPDIDGGLIGGAALDAKSFIDIVRAAV